MFKLFNGDGLYKLLKKVRLNAQAMFLVYASFIVAGGISSVFFMEGNHSLLFSSIRLGILLLPFSPFLLYDYFYHKHDKYSIFTLFKNSPGTVDALDRKLYACTQIGNRLGISDEYFFSLKSSFYIPFAIPVSHLQAAYFKRRRFPFLFKLNHSKNLYLITKNGELYTLPLGGDLLMRKKFLDRWILTTIKQQAPHLFIGYRFSHFSTNNLKHLEEFHND